MRRLVYDLNEAWLHLHLLPHHARFTSTLHHYYLQALRSSRTRSQFTVHYSYLRAEANLWDILTLDRCQELSKSLVSVYKIHMVPLSCHRLVFPDSDLVRH